MALSKTIFSWVAGLALAGATVFSAAAAPVTFNFVFKEPAGTAQASGSVTFESTLLPNPGAVFIALPDPSVLDIRITVTGATAGNGTFTTANFSNVVWDTGGATLDLSRPLIGQPTPGGPWGPPATGDFNFIGGGGSAPRGTSPFVMGANNAAANSMVLVSVTPASQVPTLGEWMLLVTALGLATIGIATLRRKRG